MCDKLSLIIIQKIMFINSTLIDKNVKIARSDVVLDSFTYM